MKLAFHETIFLYSPFLFFFYLSIVCILQNHDIVGTCRKYRSTLISCSYRQVLWSYLGWVSKVQLFQLTQKGYGSKDDDGNESPQSTSPKFFFIKFKECLASFESLVPTGQEKWLWFQLSHQIKLVGPGLPLEAPSTLNVKHTVVGDCQHADTGYLL